MCSLRHTHTNMPLLSWDPLRGDMLPDVAANEQLLLTSTAACLIATATSLLPWWPELCANIRFTFGQTCRAESGLVDLWQPSSPRGVGLIGECWNYRCWSCQECVMCVRVGVCKLAVAVIKYMSWRWKCEIGTIIDGWMGEAVASWRERGGNEIMDTLAEKWIYSLMNWNTATQEDPGWATQLLLELLGSLH